MTTSLVSAQSQRPAVSAAALAYGQYADIPVNNYTGTGSVTVPIHTISDGPLSLPVVLQYHTAGNDVASPASSVGLGWNLNAGGMISRTIRGLADNDPLKGYYYKGNLVSSRSLRDYDTEPDIFTYSVSGYSGKFFVDANRQVQMIPKSDVRINVIAPGFRAFDGILLTLPDGVRYHFGTVMNAGETYAGGYDYVELENREPAGIDRLVGWHLVAVETPDRLHRIDIEYARTNYTYFASAACAETVRYRKHTGRLEDEELCSDRADSYYGVRSLVPKRITSNSGIGEVEFTYGGRRDLGTSTGDGDRAKSIESVKVTDGNTCIKYDLNYSYFQDDERYPNIPGVHHSKLKLESVQKKSCDGSLTEPTWDFTYIGRIGKGGLQFAPTVRNPNIDHWGYYNFNPAKGANEYGKGLTPTGAGISIVGWTTLGRANRDSHGPAMQDGMLKKVTYPTGGSLELEYEANTYAKARGRKTAFEEDAFSSTSTNRPEESIFPYYSTITPASNPRWQLQVDPHREGRLDIEGTQPAGASHGSVEVYTTDGTLVSRISQSADDFRPAISSGSLPNVGVPTAAGPMVPGQSYVIKVIARNATVSFNITHDQDPSNVTCGGLRIKSTRIHDGIDGDKDIVQSYSYRAGDGANFSSGRLAREPKYVHGLNDRSVLFTSFSVSPLSGFDGYHIGYARVVVDKNGIGSEEYKYNVEPESEPSTQFPTTPAPYRVESGALKESSSYDEGSQVVSTSSTTRNPGDTYQVFGNSSATGRMYAVRTNIPSYDHVTRKLIYRIYNKGYQIRTAIYRPKFVTSTVDGLTTVTEYGYHTNNLLPNEVKTTDSDGVERKIVTQFAASSSVARAAVAKYNLRHLPYITEQYHGEDKVAATRLDYRYYRADGASPSSSTSGRLDIPRLYKTYQYGTTWDATGEEADSDERLKATYLRYTPEGQLAEYRDEGWGATTLTYENKKLKSKTFGGHTASYAYESFNSNKLTTVTAVDGTTTSYTYDKLGRLLTTTDDCTNILSTYIYRFRHGHDGVNVVEKMVDYTNVSGSKPYYYILTRQYKDGLGRDIINVGHRLGPDNDESIISGVDYDQYGRVARSYEPYAHVYSSYWGGYEKIPTSRAHTTHTYEASPLSRKISVTPPDWATTRFEYGVNTASDLVRKQGTNTPYNKGELTKQVTIDGNGNKFAVFQNKTGQKVLSRRTNGADQTDKRRDTYYLYDGKGRLSKVLPPGATVADEKLIYSYLYDGTDKLKSKKIPGKDRIYYRYDARDLLVAQRDGNLLAENKWYVYDHDALGRVTMEGLRKVSNSGSIISTEPLIITTYGTKIWDKDKVATVSTKILGSANDWLQTTNTYSTCGQLQSQTGNNHLDPNLSNSESTSYVYDGAMNLTSSTYNHRRLNGGSLAITSDHEYDHAGRNTKNYFKVGSGSRRQLNKLVYDEKGNVKTKYQGHTGLSGGTRDWLQKIDYFYLENGMLEGINSVRGGLTGSQVALPRHNDFGTVPNPGAPSTSGYSKKDLFYLQLYRDEAPRVSGSAPAPVRRNGDISYVVSQVRGRTQQLFGIKYDHLDQMMEAKFYERAHAASIATSKPYYRESLTYDERGNIETLDRDGVNIGQSDRFYLNNPMDKLDYKYVGASGQKSNRLRAINDTGTSKGYKPNSGTYRYDRNGNMTYDPSKEIEVEYNHLDLPKVITWPAIPNQRLVMTYSASGTLLTRQSFDRNNHSVDKRDYIGGIEYLNGLIESVAHSEGRVYMGGNGSRYDYALTDHLGNTRLLYSDLNNNGIPDVPSEIIQENHYLPFGMKMVGPWMGGSEQDDTAYEYNGIERVDDFDLGVNMAMYRTLDPVIGRWWQVDPKAEGAMGHSPYNSMWNSPIVYSDPNGDFAFLAFAAVGVATNGIINSAKGDNFFQGWAGAAIGGALSGGYLGAVGSAVSSHLPSANIALGGGFNLSISPAIAFGSNGFSIGANAGLSYSSNGFSAGIGAGIGYTNMSLGPNSVKGFTSSLGGGFSVGNSDWNAGFYTNATSGAGIGQRVAGFRANLKGVSVAYENDDAPFDLLGGAGNALKDGGDRFRSNAVSIGYAGIDLRLNMFTGDPTGRPTDPSSGYPQGYHTGKADMYRLGALSLGYNGYRAGWNSEGIRNKFQNEFAHQKIRPQAYFRRLPSGYPGTFYSQASSFQNPYSLWSF